MTIWDYMDKHPAMTIMLAILGMVTTVGVFEQISLVWRGRK